MTCMDKMFLIYVGVFFCRHYNECTLQGSIVIVAMLINIHVFFVSCSFLLHHAGYLISLARIFKRIIILHDSIT